MTVYVEKDAFHINSSAMTSLNFSFLNPSIPLVGEIVKRGGIKDQRLQAFEWQY